MARNFPGQTLPPAEVAAAALKGLEDGDAEVLVDRFCRGLKAGLSTESAMYLSPKPPGNTSTYPELRAEVQGETISIVDGSRMFRALPSSTT
jgi:hypothetical protein